MQDHQRIAHDDWSDQDLLTKDEAAERLVQEIADMTAQLATDGPVDATVERRLRALREAHALITQA